MKFTLRLRTASAPLSRLFYENELAMFKLEGSIWVSGCTLRAIDSDDTRLELSTFHSAPGESAFFILTVDNCQREFLRLLNTEFVSGGKILPGKNGRFGIFEYPAGRNFTMEDPAGNKFLIHEDFSPETM